jgi:hypothetical protein
MKTSQDQRKQCGYTVYYVTVYVCTYIYIHVCIYVCIYIYIDIHAPCTHTCVRSHPEISSSARIQRGHCCENPRKKPEIETHGFQQIFPSIHSLKGFLGWCWICPTGFGLLAVPSVIHCCQSVRFREVIGFLLVIFISFEALSCCKTYAQ